jgi:hypothetical protein
MSYTRPEVLACLTKAVRKILVFRGKTEEAQEPIPEDSDLIQTYGFPSVDLTQVGPELARESDELDLPNEVYDWADDSSGTRRYRTLSEIADRVMEHLAKQGEQKK